MEFIYEAEFWVAVSFFMFIGVLVYLGIHKKVASALDARAPQDRLLGGVAEDREDLRVDALEDLHHPRVGDGDQLGAEHLAHFGGVAGGGRADRVCSPDFLARHRAVQGYVLDRLLVRLVHPKPRTSGAPPLRRCTRLPRVAARSPVTPRGEPTVLTHGA